MLHILRITLMWLVALAVPAQGYATATMFGCGPGHHSMAETPSHAEATGERAAQMPQHGHDGNPELGFEHHHHGSVEQAHGHTLKAHGAAAKVAKGSSSSCASCCVVAALPTSVVVFKPIRLVDFFASLATRSVASFLTDGPERPPRFVLV